MYTADDVFVSSTAMPTSSIAGAVKTFSVLDYFVFCTLMLTSGAIGVYFAFFAKQKQNTTKEYLMGGKNMGLFPITMSLVASYISGVSLLGVPAEIYTFGTQYGVIIIAEVMVCVLSAYAFMPVFYKLQLFSSFEYLQMRYDNSVRLFLSVLYCLMTILYTPLIIYIPSLAFSQVSGINLYVVAVATCAICIFYTSLGGLKAVVWSDTVQSFAMILGVIAVTVLGTMDVGGVGVVLERATTSNRIEIFNLDPNPLVRHTFWTVVIGNFFMWLSHIAANQAILQRCLALPTIGKARSALISLSIGISTFVVFSVYSGLVIYAKYHDCDPVYTKAIRKVDQILPFTVMDLSNSVPGFPGIFIAGVFSAALSSMSTMLNSMSGVILQDFIRPCWGKRPLSEMAASTIMKVIVVLIGSLCVVMVLIVDRLGAIIQVSRTLSGITAGASLGIFVLGMTVPWLNAKGVLWGGISSIFVAGWVALGSQTALRSGTLRFENKPLSVDGCLYDFPSTNETLNFTPVEDAFWVFRISYLYLTVIGFTTLLVVAFFVTLATGPNDISKMNPDLFSPLVQGLFPKKQLPEDGNAEIKLLHKKAEAGETME
ncbi:sodium-coupled monocarboxylate transporter 2-like [Neocloeon triangulifer]|uniref:sodium-coupled monocarboxylate transporter 2-like n=1 Tax=Neocloeon triangulifer TaxID=2078957 RepID=UPI00286EF68A|nr:sodium-coupled monocarboxylate transporter 2-like [Neocloeon triangulifer]